MERVDALGIALGEDLGHHAPVMGPDDAGGGTQLHELGLVTRKGRPDHDGCIVLRPVQIVLRQVHLQVRKVADDLVVITAILLHQVRVLFDDGVTLLPVRHLDLPKAHGHGLHGGEGVAELFQGRDGSVVAVRVPARHLAEQLVEVGLVHLPRDGHVRRQGLVDKILGECLGHLPPLPVCPVGRAHGIVQTHGATSVDVAAARRL